MIISRCPLRVSLIGGGTDIPSVSSVLGGGLSIGFSFNWRMTLIGHSFLDKLVLKYSEIETVEDVYKIKHSIFREVISRIYPSLNCYEITSMCDVIGGTGLGSSSAFTVALINLLYYKLNKNINKLNLAYEASIAEIEWVGSKIGLQDSFLCSLGGVNLLEFDGINLPNVQQIKFNDNFLAKSTSPFMLFKINGIHNSSDQLIDINTKIKYLNKLLYLVPSVKNAIQQNNIEDLAGLVDEGWQLKKEIIKNTDIYDINNLYEQIKIIDPKAGGKLLGSGGGGFFLVISNQTQKIKEFFGQKAINIKVNNQGAFVSNA